MALHEIYPLVTCIRLGLRWNGAIGKLLRTVLGILYNNIKLLLTKAAPDYEVSPNFLGQSRWTRCSTPGDAIIDDSVLNTAIFLLHLTVCLGDLASEGKATPRTTCDVIVVCQ